MKRRESTSSCFSVRCTRRSCGRLKRIYKNCCVPGMCPYTLFRPRRTPRKPGYKCRQMLVVSSSPARIYKHTLVPGMWTRHKSGGIYHLMYEVLGVDVGG